MSKYRVFLTERSLKDLENISSYISDVLSSPLAAVNLEIKLTEAALSLEENPYRAPKYSERYELVPEKSIRKLIVDNYLILFYVEETNKAENICFFTSYKNKKTVRKSEFLTFCCFF